MNGSIQKTATDETFSTITRVTHQIRPVSPKVLIAFTVAGLAFLSWRQINIAISQRRLKAEAIVRAQKEEERRLREDAEKDKEAAATMARENALTDNIRKNTALFQDLQKDSKTLNDILALENRLASMLDKQNTTQRLVSQEKSLKSKQEQFRSSLRELDTEAEKQRKSLGADEAAKTEFEKSENAAGVLKKHESVKKAVTEDMQALDTIATKKSDFEQQLRMAEMQLTTVSQAKANIEAQLAREEASNAAFSQGDTNSREFANKATQRRQDLLDQLDKIERQSTPQLGVQSLPSGGQPQISVPSSFQQAPSAVAVDQANTVPIDTSSAISFVQRHLQLLERAQYPQNGAPNAEFEKMMADYAPMVFFHEKGRVDISTVRTDRVGYVTRIPQRTLKYNTITSQKHIRVPEYGANDVLEISFQWAAKIGDGQFRPFFDTWQIVGRDGRLQIISEKSLNDKM